MKRRSPADAYKVLAGRRGKRRGARRPVHASDNRNGPRTRAGRGFDVWPEYPDSRLMGGS